MFFEIHVFVHALPDLVESLRSDQRHPPPYIVKSFQSDSDVHAPHDIVEFIVSMCMFSMEGRSMAEPLLIVLLSSLHPCCTLLQQAICHALTEYVLPCFPLLNVQCHV